MPFVEIIGTRGYPSYYGGFETAVRKVAPYLADAGWAITVYGRRGSTRLDDPKRDARIKSVETVGLETKSLSTLTYGFFSCIHAAVHKPDVALVMNVANGFWLPLLRLRRVPTLVNVDGMEWERAKWGPLAKFVFRTGAKLTAKFADELIFDSVEIGRRWKAEFGRDGTFIPYGGESNELHPLLSGLTHRGYVLMIARFVPENTVSEFFSAAEYLCRHWDIVVVGASGYGGELDDRAQALADSSPKVHWLGHVSDDDRLASLWQHAGVYFHGHSVGGTNPALVQAMASSAPIVARDTVYNREVLGGSGAFVQPDSAAIAEQIDALMRDASLQEQLSQAAAHRAAESYTWTEVARRYAASLDGLRQRRE